MDRRPNKDISFDEWINKECKQRALLEACGHRYLAIDSSDNDTIKQSDFINQTLSILSELWKKENIFKSKMFDDMEQEIQRQEKKSLGFISKQVFK